MNKMLLQRLMFFFHLVDTNNCRCGLTNASVTLVLITRDRVVLQDGLGVPSMRSLVHVFSVASESWYAASFGLSRSRRDISCALAASVAVLAEISLRSPRKLFIFIIKKIIYRIKVSKK